MDRPRVECFGKLKVGRRGAGLPPVKGFVWRLAQGQRVPLGWYFDHEAERLPDNPPGSGFGFPPGFLVTADGMVRVVKWHELREVCPVPPGQ